MSNKKIKHNIWDLVTSNKTTPEKEPTNENISKKRRIILNNSQKLKSVQYKTSASSKKQLQIAKYLSMPKNYSIPSEYSSFPILRSTSYSNNFITSLNPVVWIDASDLTSILRDSVNNVYQILDKSGNNNHLYQNTLINQPKYHNGGLLFNSNQYLVSNNTFTQSINNMSMFVILKQYNQSTNQGIISGRSTTATSDDNNINAWALLGSDTSTFQYEFITNNTTIKNTNDITKTMPYGIYEIIIDDSVGNLYYDGTLINTTTFTGLGSFTNLILGARYLSSNYSNFFNGEIYEVLILDSVLNTSDRYKVEKYLLDKWSTTQISRTIPLTNIYTWLDASSPNNFTLDADNKVLSWKDKNNNLNFTQSNASFYPLFDTNKVVFDDSYLSMSDTSGLNLNNFSIFYVFQENTHNDNAGLLSCINSLEQTDNTVTNGFALTTPTSGNVRLSINSINLSYNGGNPLTKKLYEFNVVNGNGSIYINGVLQSTTNFNTLGTGKIFSIGARQNSSIFDTSNPLQANIYELIILSTNTSYSQRSQIYSYLSEKWNLTISRLSPAPDPTFWLDSNNNSSITVNGSNQITSWSDLSSNNYTTSINNIKPVLQTVNGKKLAYFNGSDVSINFGTNLTGANNSIYVVFSANSSIGSDKRLISFNNGTNDTGSNTFNLNSEAGSNILKYNSNSDVSSTVIFNNSLYIYSLQRNNNVTSIYINNYLVNTITNDTNYNFARLDLGSILGGSNFWTGYIPEVIVYTTLLDESSNTNTINYLANKWGITIQPSLINEFIPRNVNTEIKFVPFTNIFTSNANYLTISDTNNKAGALNLNIDVPVTNTLQNQLSIISTDPVYLSVIDKNIIYNLSLFVSGTSIVLPTLLDEIDYFAFINNTSYDITITGPNSLNSVINANTTTPTYFTKSGGGYNVGSSFTGFNCFLNQYDNNLTDTFIVYLGGWSSSLSYIKNLYVYDTDNNYVATTGPIYFDDTYQCEFTQTLSPGTYTFVISDLKSAYAGNIIIATIGTPVVINNPSATLDHYSGGTSTYIITLINWSNVFSDITTLDVWVSDNSSHTGSTYLLTTDTIQENSGVYTASFTYEFGDGYYWISLRKVTSIHNLVINITNPIVKTPTFSFSLDQTTHSSPYNVILGAWNDSLTNSIPTLYIFGYLNSDFSDTPILLLSVNTTNITSVGGVYKLPFSYIFDVARTYYLSVSDTNDLSGAFNVELTNYINSLTITATCNLTYGFINYNNVFTLTLSNNESYDLSLYRTKWFIYHADNNSGNNFKLISRSTLNNDQTITFTFNPSSSLSNPQYFYVSNTNHTVLAIGNGSSTIVPIAYSYDITNWYYAPSSIQIFCQSQSYPNPNVNVIASNGYLWVAGSYENGPLPYQIAYSTDGINWYGSVSGNTIIQNTGTGAYLRDISLNADKTIWVFISNSNSSGNFTLATSSDGINWTKITSMTLNGSSGPFIYFNFSQIVHDGSKWLMVGGYQVSNSDQLNYLAYSTDLINWTSINFSNYVTSIIYGNSVWLGAGANNNLYYSTNGFDWVTTTTSLSSYQGPFYFANNRFFISISNGTAPFYTSTDGLTWTICTISPTQSSNLLNGNVIWYNNKYYGAYQYDNFANAIIQSDDGISWTFYSILNNNFTNILSTASYTPYLKNILSTTPVTFTTLSVTVSENQISGSTLPLSISGLHGWYDGGDISTIINSINNVTIWQDKSGNNFDASVNDPTNTPVLQTTGGILFSGATGQHFNLPNNAIPYNNTSYTIITVFSNATSGGFISGGNSTTSQAFNSVEITNTNYVSNLWSGSGTSGNLESSHVIQTGTNIVYADYYTGGTHNLILDVLYSNNNTPSTRVQTNTNNTIGYSPVGGSLDGIVNEILIFNRILTISERELLEGYLTWKWDITTYLPWTHQYKFTQPSMIAAYPKDPFSYAGLVSWYDFGDVNNLNLIDNTVDTVYDKNNNANDLNNVSDILPVFLQGEGVILDGSQYFQPDFFVQNLNTFTIYIVFSQSVKKSNAGVLGFISSSNDDTSVGGMSFNTGSGTSNFNITNANFNVSSTNTNISTSIYSIVCTAGVISIYYNGVLNGTTTISSSNGVSANLIVGSRFANNTPGNGLDGVLKEIIIYSTVASTQTRQELEGYLAQKWYIQYDLPANHPYRYISPGTNSNPLNPLTNNPTDRWYDGNDQSFFDGLIWYDKSLSESQLTYTGGSITVDSNIIPGMKSIKFLGNNNYFEDDFGLNIDSNEYTISFVFSMDSSIISDGRILSLYNTGDNDYDNASSIGIGQIDTNSICLYNNNTNTTPITVVYNTFNFVSFIIDSVTGNVFSYLNGTLVSTDNLNISLSTTLLTIGNDGNSNGFTYKGYINEIVLHPYALKDDNRKVLEGYFAWKWKLDSLLPAEHPYYDLPPIVSIPSFSPNQIGGLDIWSDANDLPNHDFIDGQTITNWPNRSTSSVYTGYSENTYPVFNRWGFNGQPTVTYTPGNYTIFIDPSNQNTYVTTVATLLGISKNDGGNTAVITGARIPSLIGYTPYGKNGLILNNNNISTNYIPNNTNWDNYTMVKNPDGTIQFSNYDLNLPTTSSYTGSLDIGYNNYVTGNSTVSEVLVYSHNLPLYYVQKLQGYLTWKWGLQQNLSISHPFRFEMPNKEETLFTLKLGGWTSNINITTLYIFDTFSSTLLTTLTNFFGNDTVGYFAIFTYRFPQAQNYLTIANTDDMSGTFTYPIPIPLQISAKLTILVAPVDPINNWGYFNVSKTYSFVLKSYYEGTSVNFKDYYSTLKVYYSQYSNYTSLNLIGNATVSNDGTTVTFTFNYNPSTISYRSLYFYFAYSDVPSGLDSATSPVYVFFDRTSLTFTLNRYSYFNPYTITMNFPQLANFIGNVLYVYYSKNDPTYSGNVYANQTYVAPINVTNYSSGTFSLAFPSPNTGKYYLTVSNINQFGTRTVNDINVNIALPIYVNTVNVALNKNYGFFQSINQFVGLVGTYNDITYPFPTIRIFYSTVVATQYSDLTELTNSPFTVINNGNTLTTNFNFDNSTLRSSTIYFYFTADTNQVPRFDSFTYEGPLTFYDKTTLTFSLDHYDNISNVFIVTADNWTSLLNVLSPLNVYILDLNNNSVNPPLPITFSLADGVYTSTFTFNFNFLDAGSYTIVISDSNLLSSYINYTIPTPITVNLLTSHFILQNSQFTQTQTFTIPVTPFEPTQIPGLTLWLDATQITAGDGSSISTWEDNSGNGYNADVAEGAPTYVASGINGLPSVQFSTGYNMVSNVPVDSFSDGNGMTVFIVYQSVGTPSTKEGLLSRTYPDNQIADPIVFANNLRTIGNSLNTTVITSPVNFNGNTTPSIFYANIDPDNYIYLESNTFINLINTTFDYWDDAINEDKLYIGTSDDGTVQFNGYISEILIYNNPITESQKYQVEGYLAYKWNYQLPTNHPFYNFSPDATTQTVIKQAFVPTQISNIALWLDASDSSSITGSSPVTAWNDKSGLSKNATGNGTLGYVNKSIVFNGTDSYFTLPNGTLPFNNSSYSYFVVAKINSTASSNGLIGGGTNSINNQSFNIRSSGSQISTAWTNNNSNDITTNINFVTNQIFLAESLYDGTNRNVYYNSLLDKSGTPSTTRSQTNTNNVIGSSTANQILNGNIYEIIVFSRNITAYERQQVEGYLANKWNVTIRPTLPIDITNLSIWLDAIDPNGDGTAIANNTIISTWYDKSGNNNDFTAATPTTVSIPEYQNNLIGSLPGINFQPNNVGGYISSNPISYTPDLTIIMVVNLPTNILGNNNTLFVHGQNLLLFRDSGNANQITLGFNANYSTNITPLYVPTIFYGTVADLNKTTNLNGISSNQSLSSSNTYSGANVSDSYTASIGVKNNDSWLDNGSVGEVIYFNKVLSSLEKEKMISYLSNKWNIIYSESYIHPYISTIPPILYRISEPDIPILFIPTQLSGLALWLDGQDITSVVLSGNNVTQWNDKSGNSKNATGVSNPQWQTTYGISLSGSDSFTLPDGTLPFNNSSYSYYIVAKFTGSGTYSIISGGNQASSGNKFELKTNSSKNIITSWYQNDLTSKYKYVTDNPTLIESFYSSSTGDRFMYFDSIIDNVNDSFSVAVGENYIAYSYDTLNWTKSTSDPFDGAIGKSVAWNGSYWIAVGYSPSGGIIAKSNDGDIWTTSTDTPLNVINDVKWNESYWVAVGSNSDNTVCITTSSDGVSWTASTSNPLSGGTAVCVAWNGTQWLVGGNNPDSVVCIAVSTDGTNWVASTNNPFSIANGFAWNGTFWIGVGYQPASNSIAKSTDGMNWTLVASSLTDVYKAVAWNGTYWVAVGIINVPSVSIAVSTDGDNWIPSTNNPFSDTGSVPTSITWTGTIWIVVGYNTAETIGIFTSTDGMTWTAAKNNPFYGNKIYGVSNYNINIGTRTQVNTPNTIGVGMEGIIYEIIVYNSLLTSSQQEKVEYYLSNKWSIYYDPTSIPNLFNWIDASDTNTLFQDLNGQIPVTGNGQNINYVLDKSSNNIIFNSWNIYAPKYNTKNVNNLPSINCYNDGNSWGGLVTKNYYQKSEDVTVFWFGTFHSWYGGNQSVWSHSSDADTLGPPHNDIGMRYSGNNKINFQTNGDTTNCLLDFVDDRPMIYWATMTNGTILKANMIDILGNVQSITYTEPNKSWTPGLGRIWISTNSAGLAGMVNLSEYIYYQRALDADEINNILRYLGNKWNILIPSDGYNILSMVHERNVYVESYQNNFQLVNKNVSPVTEVVRLPLLSSSSQLPLLSLSSQDNLLLSNPETISTNQSITLSLSSYYSPIYLYYGTTDMSYYSLLPINNPITNNNIYHVNPSNNSFTFNFTNTTLSLKNIYFYTSTGPNYTGVSGKSLPFKYINKNLFSITLDHYDISTNVYNVTLSGYNILLLNNTLKLMAIKNNTSYINLNQTLALTSVNNSNTDFTGSFTYTFDPYDIYNLVITNSVDLTNVEPNGDIYIESSNIYGFSLTSTLSTSNVYPGLNSPNMNFAITGLSSQLTVSDYVPNGNILINNYALVSNPQTMNINQININLYKYQNSGFTIWLDAKDLSSITKDANNLVSNWSDKSDSINDGTQSTALNQPIYISTDNSIYLSDSVNPNYLNVPPTTFNNTYFYTFSMVLKAPINFGEANILGKFLGTSRANNCNLYITSTVFFFKANSLGQIGWDFPSPITNDIGKFLLTFTCDSNTFKLWQNGQLLLDGPITNMNIPNAPTFDTSFDTCCIGGPSNSNIYLYELIYNETYLYDDEIQKIEAYLSNKWGISNLTNPYMNSIISFTPNSVLYNDSIEFSTTDNNLTTTNSMTQLLINCVITYTTSYKITLSNWNPTVTTVYLYVGINSKYYDRTMVQSLAVTHNTGDDTYYINLNVNRTYLTNNTYYFSLRDVNADIFGFDLRVADPDSYFTIANPNYMTLSISPATCVLNQNNSLTITFTFSGSTPANIYLYSCPAIYTTGNVGSGSHDLTVITTLTTATDLTDNQATITFNPTSLPVYILASTGVGFTGYYGYSNKLTLSLSLALQNDININTTTGIIDSINEFSVDLQPHYRNVQVNNSNIIINHTIDIDNNKIVFSYDSGFEYDVIFNIINSKTNQIYDSLKVIFS